MSFGETLLKKFGWKEGKGLGTQENGIRTALRPKLKFNTVGFGFDSSADFTTRWWDNIYNKSAKAISVEKNEDGEVYLSKAEDKKSQKNIETEKKKSHYCKFIKGSVLKGLNEIPQNENCISSDEESDKLVKRLGDEELFNYCGQLTAHKGARHGLTMSAKLARLQQQEAAFLNSKNDFNAQNFEARDANRGEKVKDKDDKEPSTDLNLLKNNDIQKKRVRDDERSEEFHAKSYCESSSGNEVEISRKVKKKKKKDVMCDYLMY